MSETSYYQSKRSGDLAMELTAEEHRQLVAGEREVAALLPKLDQLEKCGANCQLLRQQITETLDRSANLRQFFKPSNAQPY